MEFSGNPLYGEFLEEEKSRTEIESEGQFAYETDSRAAVLWDFLITDQGMKANPNCQRPQYQRKVP